MSSFKKVKPSGPGRRMSSRMRSGSDSERSDMAATASVKVAISRVGSRAARLKRKQAAMTGSSSRMRIRIRRDSLV